MLPNQNLPTSHHRFSGQHPAPSTQDPLQNLPPTSHHRLPGQHPAPSTQDPS
jgi:hypothetical protein